ncbi:hypothetical protein FNF27_01419 [Cafeteria roenbergensis]|uniref:threonine--tRNA ligase n=1 Tax=Cafeteria roenbergensis TaxID=33653 RepID=A0A5A8EHM2_CAFRO|nr:hypothetical protein FNF27_01419 [Cafeteria roenbergensis]
MSRAAVAGWARGLSGAPTDALACSWVNDDPWGNSLPLPGRPAGVQGWAAAGNPVFTETAVSADGGTIATLWDAIPEGMRVASDGSPVVAAVVNGMLFGVGEQLDVVASMCGFTMDSLGPVAASPVHLCTPLGRHTYWLSAAHLLAAGIARCADRIGADAPRVASLGSRVPEAVALAHLEAIAETQAVRRGGFGAPRSHPFGPSAPSWAMGLQGAFDADVILGGGMRASGLKAADIAKAAAAVAKKRRRFVVRDGTATLDATEAPISPEASSQAVAARLQAVRLPDTSMLRGAEAFLQVVAQSEVALPVLGGAGQEVHATRYTGVAWPSKAVASGWELLREEAEARDHRRVGTAQGLWALHPSAPGSPYFLPHGVRVLSRLRSLVRSEIAARGYQEVETPQLFSTGLWQRSGHWANYREDMFVAAGAGDWAAGGAAVAVPDASAAPGEPGVAGSDEVMPEGEAFGVKPMNCPAHCVVFGLTARSYRELPLRVADFGALHRNEASGALTGLTRVRRFHQDDAHIFCAAVEDGGMAQVQAEVGACLDMVHAIFSQACGLEYALQLATRPDKRLGSDADWDAAEAALKDAMASHAGRAGQGFQELPVAEGDGAFYGPKIDITATDAVGRRHQCATVQLDFQLAGRFNLRYQSPDGELRTPVIVHRALLGSFERMLAVLAEHFAGRWPLWLAPRQVSVIPLPQCGAAGEAAAAVLRASSPLAVPHSLARWQFVGGKDAVSTSSAWLGDGTGLFVEVDDSDRSLPKRVRESQMSQTAAIVAVGRTEAAAGTLPVRLRDRAVADAFAAASIALARQLAALGAVPAPAQAASARDPETERALEQVALEEAAALVAAAVRFGAHASGAQLASAACPELEAAAATLADPDSDADLTVSLPAGIAASVLRIATKARL